MGLLSLIVQFVLGFGLLVGGAELLVRGASRLAARFNMPPVLIGLTVVAFGTSMPELVVSLTAAFNGEASDIAIGNIVGSNIANLGLILGLCGLFAALNVAPGFPRRELPILFGVTVAFTVLCYWNSDIDRLEGLLMILGLVAFTWLSWRAAKQEPAFQQEVQQTVDVTEQLVPGAAKPGGNLWLDLAAIAGGLVGLVWGANLLVNAASEIARSLGVSEVVIGLTLVAVGTSLPEVAASLVAVVRGNSDLAVGNVVGSNMINILGIAGITALVRPLATPVGMEIDFGVMILLTGLVWLFAWRKPHAIVRWEALVLLGVYAAFIVKLVLFP